jgi:hypothetical protein
MNRQHSIASLLAACGLALGLLAVAPTANTASADQSVRKSREGARDYVLERKHRVRRRARAPTIPQPRGPAYIYYDYPYYYARGHYPTHIVRYLYYPPPSYSRRPYPRYGRRCSQAHGACARKKGACKCR